MKLNISKFKKLNFYIKRAWLDMVDPNAFGVSVGFRGDAKSGLEPYMLDYGLDGMVGYYNLLKDVKGVVRMQHFIDDPARETEGHYYSPVKIAHYGIACINTYLKSGDSRILDEARVHCDWLLQNVEYELNSAFWSTPSSNPKYELRSGYKSAIVQGLVASFLSRMYLLEESAEIGDVLGVVFGLFEIDVEKGGLLARTAWGSIYEEYPCEPYSHVVNGFMFALAGIWDVHSAIGDEALKVRFEDGIKALVALSEQWFLDDGWCTYDLRHVYDGSVANYATRHYQYLHRDQLLGLGRCVTDPALKQAIIGMADRISEVAPSRTLALKAYTSKFRKFV